MPVFITGIFTTIGPTIIWMVKSVTSKSTTTKLLIIQITLFKQITLHTTIATQKKLPQEWQL